MLINEASFTSFADTVYLKHLLLKSISLLSGLNSKVNLIKIKPSQVAVIARQEAILQH